MFFGIKNAEKQSLSSGAVELKYFLGTKNAEKQTLISGALELKDFVARKMQRSRP